MQFFHFNQKEHVEGNDLQERFGLRGRNLLQLASLNTPLVPGFLIESKDLPALVELDLAALKPAIRKIESIAGREFGNPEKPMLLKVVVSPSIQIGTFRSTHTIGMNDRVAEGLAKRWGDEFTYHEYKVLLERFGSVFLGRDVKSIEDAVQGKTASKEICQAYLQGPIKDFPQDGYEQLQTVLSQTAKRYLADDMNEDIEAALLVQLLVYGNWNENSGSGHLYSRDIVTGSAGINGVFSMNSFDVSKESGRPLEKLDVNYLKQLQEMCSLLESSFKDIREIKFTIEDGKIWLIEQTPVDGKSTQAEIRTLLDLYRKKLLTREDIVHAVPAGQMQDLLHPVIDHASVTNLKMIKGGIAGSPGAAVGRVCFSTHALLAEHRRCSLKGEKADFILVMPHTDAGDVEGIEMCAGVLASVGGYSSHAPVVSRSLRKPCLLYSDVQFFDGYATIGGERVNEWDIISLESPTYTEPSVWFGEASMQFPDTAKNGLEEFIRAIDVTDGVGTNLRILGLAATVGDVDSSIRLGAGGIGLLPVEAMMRDEKTARLFQEVVLLYGEKEKYTSALKRFRDVLSGVCEDLFKKMDGKKVIIRLLNTPLIEFLPVDSHARERLFQEISQLHGVEIEHFNSRASNLRNVNPMMGQRGGRICIAYPEIYQAISGGIFYGACRARKSGVKLDFDLCVSGVVGDAEMRFIRHGRNIESNVIHGVRGIEQQVLKELGETNTELNYRVGAVIDLPAATLMAGHLAKQAEFFVIDFTMLTQTANGMSADDLNTFLPAYNQYDILKDNPFEVLSVPVKELVSAVVQYGRMIRPDIEIGGVGSYVYEPENIDFAYKTGLDFVVSAPYGVPIAKLSAMKLDIARRG